MKRGPYQNIRNVQRTREAEKNESDKSQLINMQNWKATETALNSDNLNRLASHMSNFRLNRGFLVVVFTNFKKLYIINLIISMYFYRIIFLIFSIKVPD